MAAAEIVCVAELVQPFVVPVTVYVTVETGLMVTTVPLPLGDQLYVLAPLAVNVTASPEHTLLEDADKAVGGSGFTVTVAAAVPVQPFVVPDTVYVVVVVNPGVVTLAPVPRPPVHVYVVPPLAFSVAVCPVQILGEFTVTVGFGFTVTVTDAVPCALQPDTVPVTV